MPDLLSSAEIIGIREVNSVDFVERTFETYNQGAVVALLKNADPGIRLTREISPKLGGGWLNVRQGVIRDRRPAQIVLTSGTEGAPKPILLSHEGLADVAHRLNAVMEVDDSIREYVGVPVTYSFGFGRCRAVAAAGGQCFIPEHGFNPTELARMLAGGEINAISAVPTLWRTLLHQPDAIDGLGRKVKWIEIGSQYMSRAEKESMKALFPNAVIVQHYGLTEASRTTFLKINETAGELLESVGRAFGQVNVKTSSERRIMIRGPHVAMGQFLDGQLVPLVDAEGWYTTGDLGRVQDGYLYFEGRADDLINCGGVKVNPDVLQERINARLNAERGIAVCRIPDALRGDGIFIAIESDTGVDLQKVREAAHRELLAMNVNVQSSLRVQAVPSILRTDTGKVRRKDLARHYAASPEVGGKANTQPKGHPIRALFAGVFPAAEIKSSDSFRSLGGDSLNYVQMLMALEKRFDAAPANWEEMTVGELEDVERSGKSSLLDWLDTSIFLRVIAILGVVATHSGGRVFSGGTWLLFMLIGYNMARFKATDLAGGNGWQWIKSYMIAILVPYYLVTILYLGWKRSFEIDELLLYANLVSAKITVVFPFWFVQVLLQCMIAFGVLFSVPAMRRLASGSMERFSLVVLALLLSIRVLYPFLWDTAHLNDLVPPRFMPILWLGWCFCVVRSPRYRLALAATGIALALVDARFTVEATWMILGSVFLTFVLRVPVPRFAKTVLRDIGAATFHIFIFNGIVISLWQHIVPVESPAIIFCVAMIGSMSAWWLLARMNLMARLRAITGMRNRALDSAG
jgi:acyl-CoA synthetase (AMP-forming)/AMP-acid ligase II/acyl carrier protein